MYGIKTDPGYKLFTADNEFLPTGKTPKKLYLTVAGTDKSEFWLFGDADPWNGTILLESADGELYTGSNGIAYGTVEFQYNYTYALVECFSQAVFYAAIPTALSLAGAFTPIWLVAHYQGGNYTCTFREASTQASIQATCADIGITPGKKTIDVLTNCADDRSIIHNIFRKFDKTRIRVKRTIT